MIVSQITTIVFEYPQDYLQEQEWLKEKAEQWVHIGTDTQCAIYEYQYSEKILTINSIINQNIVRGCYEVADEDERSGQ